MTPFWGFFWQHCYWALSTGCYSDIWYLCTCNPVYLWRYITWLTPVWPFVSFLQILCIVLLSLENVQYLFIKHNTCFLENIWWSVSCYYFVGIFLKGNWRYIPNMWRFCAFYHIVMQQVSRSHVKFPSNVHF